MIVAINGISVASYTPLDKATLLVGTVGAQITIRSVETDAVEIQF